MKSSPQQTSRAQTVATVVLAVIACAAVFYVMRSVVLPVILALFLAVLSRPLQRRLQHWMPQGLALTVTVLFMSSALLALPLLLSASLQVLVRRLPEYGPQFQILVSRFENWLIELGLAPSAFNVEPERLTQSLITFASDALQNIASFMGTFVIVLFLLAFMLSEALVLKTKLARALKPSNHAAVLQSVASMQKRIQRYVTTKTLFAVVNGACAGLLTWFFSVDLPLLWALITFLLNFIPTFGPLIAGLPPVLLAFVQFETPHRAIGLFFGLLVTFNLLGNLLEPRFLGRSLSLSPLVVFLSLIVWGWYFGLVGVILSVPLTVGLVIVCYHIESLHPLAILLSDKPWNDEAPSTPSST